MIHGPYNVKLITQLLFRASDSKPKMPMDLYYFPPSPPCRSVLLLAKRLGIEFNLKTVNVLAGEHQTPEFIKV